MAAVVSLFHGAGRWSRSVASVVFSRCSHTALSGGLLAKFIYSCATRPPEPRTTYGSPVPPPHHASGWKAPRRPAGFAAKTGPHLRSFSCRSTNSKSAVFTSLYVDQPRRSRILETLDHSSSFSPVWTRTNPRRGIVLGQYSVRDIANDGGLSGISVIYTAHYVSDDGSIARRASDTEVRDEHVLQRGRERANRCSSHCVEADRVRVPSRRCPRARGSGSREQGEMTTWHEQDSRRAVLARTGTRIPRS